MWSVGVCDADWVGGCFGCGWWMINGWEGMGIAWGFSKNYKGVDILKRIAWDSYKIWISSSLDDRRESQHLQ